MKIEIVVARSASHLEFSVAELLDDGWRVRFESYCVIYDESRKLLVYSLILTKGE